MATEPGEYYSLILLATTGMLFMASGFNLLSIWISLELMALSSYILAGYFKHETRSNEAAMKYFVLGALSSGILLYGISLIYGGTQTLALSELPQRLIVAHGRGQSAGRDRLDSSGSGSVLQGVGGTLPCLDTRCVCGCADAGNRVSGGGLQGGFPLPS